MNRKNEGNRDMICILSNVATPGYILVMATNEKTFVRDYTDRFGPGVILPFQCECAVIVDDSAAVEEYLHEAFFCSRVSARKGFFEARPVDMIAVLKRQGDQDVTKYHARIINAMATAQEKEVTAQIRGLSDDLKCCRVEPIT